MNDDFLKNYAKRPNPQFAEDLYRRIERRERTSSIMRKFALSLAALMIVFSAVFAASPAVRAATIEFLQDVGGLTFIVSDNPPVVATEEVVPPTFDDVSLAEAKTRFAGPISLPEYVPEAFELQPQVRLTHIYELPGHSFARLSWRHLEIVAKNEIETFIVLEIDYAPNVDQQPGYYVGQGGVEEVDVNGTPAALIRGLWDHERGEYVDTSVILLVWQYDADTTYTLSANSSMVSETELLRMAASIQ
jgi:hypothetical protein